jgi:predicted N-acyltransferase
MRVRSFESIVDIPASEWNALTDGNNPFLRHEFLAALETTGCAHPGNGWRARHLVAYDDTGAAVGAAPLYLKDHSYGEFVFDWAWADAYARAGLAYYPKLIAAVPFSPVAGPRLLLAHDAPGDTVRSLLVEGARETANRTGASSLHWLFTTEADTETLEQGGFLRRTGCQFHWFNRGYRDFGDFLSGFSADKRKKVKRERRYVRDAGITTEVITGADITERHWETIYRFHTATVLNHGAPPFLTRAFFRALGDTMARNAVLIFARHGDEYVGAAMNLRGADALYGRYWGCARDYHSLHFEVCYYRAIEYCIAEGLARFEGGAQGEHKIARGFVPTPTFSAHWLRHKRFFDAVANYLARERAGIGDYMCELNEHVPYKERTGA